MALFELSDPGALTRPVLVVALEGWVNAGQAGTEAADVLAGEGEVVATFDSDALYDYRVTRPTVDFEQGLMSGVIWPEMTLRLGMVGGRHLLVLTGAEPNWNWRRLGREVAGLAVRLGVTEHISLGGIPWAVPHTQPVTILMTATDPAALEPSDDHPEGVLRVPGSAVSIIEHAVSGTGIPTRGYWARVPHYIGTTYHAASLALLERVARTLGIEMRLADLATQAAQQRTQLDAITEARPDIASIVAQLETLTEEQGAVSGEQIAAEIERFLRERGDEGL